MRKANITEAKNRFSELIQLASRGETVRIYDRDRPVVDWVAVRALDEDGVMARLRALEEQEVVRIGAQDLPKDFLTDLRDMPRQFADNPEGGIAAQLLKDRRDGR